MVFKNPSVLEFKKKKKKRRLTSWGNVDPMVDTLLVVSD